MDARKGKQLPRNWADKGLLQQQHKPFEAAAIELVHHAYENDPTGLFEEALFCSQLGRHENIQPKDIKLAWRIRGGRLNH
ncbi:histone H3.3-like type 1 [Drosophila obscura]|uniref:histone H3.3-like type 1 n=1 Tax=Drosophila obscura TaxID=7282 RepID=UPI000BA0D61D|nr:histone H3.3-like type 1 [Drosophila obscura]